MQRIALVKNAYIYEKRDGFQSASDIYRTGFSSASGYVFLPMPD